MEESDGREIASISHQGKIRFTSGKTGEWIQTESPWVWVVCPSCKKFDIEYEGVNCINCGASLVSYEKGKKSKYRFNNK